LIQIPDNDRLSRRIRGTLDAKRPLSFAGRYQKAVAGKKRTIDSYLTGVLKNA
jgi:hypothetical protein